jgi:hypothetical protein
MATTAAPYGGRVVKLAGNRPNNNSNSLYPIASNYGTAIFFGQPVVYSATNSSVEVPAAVDLGGAAQELYIGIFAGCTYTDPNLKYTVFRQFYPANTVASDIQAYVLDDPSSIIQFEASTTAFDVFANLGKNYALSAAAGGSTTTGNCNLALNTSSAGNNNPFKLVGIAQGPGNINAQTGNYVQVLVQSRAGTHLFNRQNA